VPSWDLMMECDTLLMIGSSFPYSEFLPKEGRYREREAGTALARQIGSLDVHDTLAVQERLPHLMVLARVAWGKRDPFQKPRYGERLAHDLGTTVQWIYGGRHFTPEDRPEEVAGPLNDLLREVEAEAAREVGASA
jgi:pimeloyl-ACP methyl ester carboxylesterase